MKAIQSIRTLLLVCFLTCQFAALAQPATAPSPSWHVYFSPRGGATSAIVQTLENARSTVLVQAYSFTSAPIAEALVRAQNRGVNVQVLLDMCQRTRKYAAIEVLMQAAIPTFIDAKHAIAHNKVMIVDSQIIITGSFNFTEAAEERNSENLLIVRDKRLASLYASNWNLHHQHCVPFS